jgi:hypothetical protein
LLRRFASVSHPILFAAFPLVSLFEHNQSEVELSLVWVPLALSVAVAVALYAIFLLVFKHAAKAGALAALVAFVFFYYGTFAATIGLADRWFFPLWAALFVLGAVALVRTRSDLANLTVVLSVSAAVLIVRPVAGIAIYQTNHSAISVSDARLWPTRLQQPRLSSAARRPDIYLLIPDDYARPDVLRHYFRYDDAGFLNQLRKRGFVLSEQARSPYSDSEMNIAAAVNMDYLSRLPSILGRKSQDVRPVSKLIQDNRAARLLHSLGYRYVHLDTDEVTFAGGNPQISRLAAPDSFANLWLRNSVLRLIGGKLGFDAAARNARFRKSIRSVFSQLEAVPQDLGPKFVLFHTLLPHDPYIYGPRGQAVTFPGHSDADLGSRLGMTYYLKQLRYLNRKLLEAVDAILARTKPPPVILIQSDEGFQADSETFGEAAMQQIRVKGLIALYLPGAGKAGVPQPPNTVNTLRFVLNHYFGTHYPMLRSASYPELDLPYQFEEMRVR